MHPRWYRTARLSIRTLQIMAMVHVVTTHVAEIRWTTGSSMLPTLAASGDQVLHVRWPLYNFTQRIKRTVSSWAATLAPTVSSSTGSFLTSGDAASRERRRLEDKAWEKINLAKGKNTYGLELGDLVVATSPMNPSKTVCKRVVGLPGDTILVDPRKDAPSITVPRGHVFLCGDNLNNSTDSRHYGPVPIGLIRGKVVARVFPSLAWLGNNLELITEGAS